MNFFERQHAARGTSTRLVALFVLAVVAIVLVVDLVVLFFLRSAPTPTLVGWLVAGGVLTIAIIGLGTLSKMLALRAGGAAVAHSVGATPIDPSTRDPRLRRLVNVVDEMSIASGVPAPRLFVLAHEPGINAFAAGYTPADAAIAVTAGALDTLNRDELQGVIGHEFSHILNGDMRLNIRLIGLLNGILLLGILGLRFLQFGGGRSRDNKGGPILLVAVLFIVLGFVGQFFAGLIKAGVSRQREWLADASAVQFTRQTDGLAGALKKIAGLPSGSTLSDTAGAKQVSHMLFGEGSRRSFALSATHPPLLERIAALEPGFDAQQAAALQQRYAQHRPDGLAEDAALGFAAPTPPPPPSRARLDPAAVSARVATMTADDLARGAGMNARIPDDLRAAATQGSTAVALVLALIVERGDDRPEHERLRGAQLHAVADRLGAFSAEAVTRLLPPLRTLDAALLLPLASLAVPQVATRPAPDRAVVAQVLDELARMDGRVTVFEYCLTRLVGAYLADAAAPTRSRPSASSAQMQDAALTLLAVLAATGNADPAAAERAFHNATAALLRNQVVPFAAPPDPWRRLDAGWAVLDALDPPHKQVLVEAMVAAVADDGVVQVAEAELLRTACALLHCPLPPLVA